MPLDRCRNESDDSACNVMLRFGSMLLTCVLLALNWGANLPPEIASLCQTFGMCGMAFYFSLELVADQRARQARANRKVNPGSGDQRLSEWIRAEEMAAQFTANERMHHSMQLQELASKQ